MARETREERTVRKMTSPLLERLLELQHLSVNNPKESAVETWSMSLIKSVLGFTASEGYFVKAQENSGKNRFDLVIARTEDPTKLTAVIEVKKLGANLDRSDFRSGKTQLQEYLKSIGNVRWGILTNGYEWRLYDFENEFINVSSVDIRNDDDKIDTSSRGVLEAAWNLLDLSELFSQSTWDSLSTEARALSPDSLAEAILSTEVVKRISRSLKEEHDFRVSVDTLTDKLAELMELGLNDMISSWNETKRAELDRYIRKQKKAAKRQKRKTNEPKTETVETNIEPAPQEAQGSADNLNEADQAKVIPFPSNAAKSDEDGGSTSNVA